MTLPDPPELVVLAVVCLATVGLLKLETIGEWVWKIRSRNRSTNDESDDGDS